MLSTRKIIRAFLASPGDLQEEREAIRRVVAEFNESWANELGYQVELVGWEETIAGFGRPQHLINQDLDRCDLFLGMIWKRWGTPPDHEGDFTSGFQEEFERSMARREKTGSPEISLFFKQISEEFLGDPGDDLKKVLAFRETITAGKKILFQKFSTVQNIEALARKCITAYVNNVRAKDELSEPDQNLVKRARSGSVDAEEGNRGHESSPLSAEGFEFLEDLLERIRQPDSLDTLSASDVARFRLLANSISKQGNENMDLGVHDINILHIAYIQGTRLGKKEISSLARLGFQRLSNENVPLWCWYAALADTKADPAIISSFIGPNENEKVGAISVLTALALELPVNYGVIKRDWIIGAWFSDDASASLRIAALGYLAKYGTADDLRVAKEEYDRSDHATSRSALECMIGILLRTGQEKAAQRLVLESQFESLNANLLKSVLEGVAGLETSDLLLGIEHRNSTVRLRAMKELYARGALNIGIAERLCGDSDVLVRNEAVEVLLKLGKPLVEEEVKKILIQKSFLGGLGIASNSEKEGEKLFLQYKFGVLKKHSEAELEKRVEASLIHDDVAYFALAKRYFRTHAKELRRDVDDRFGAYFEERIRRVKAVFSDDSALHDLVKQTMDLEEFLRKKLTRQGLDVLCAAQNSEDLQRIRANLRNGYAGGSKFDAEYLGRHGDWIDIPILVNAEGPRVGETQLTILYDEEFQLAVAKAITSIGKKYSVTDLLSLEMPAAILKKTIELCAESRFAKISQDALLALFDHESDEVRKAAALLTVRSFPANRIRIILREYVGRDKYRYYNVIHWLDLGASMSRDDAKKVVRAASN